ncbi:MAG: hypothetical protein JJ899_05530 [Alphaproteobacteria bacterium]|nr:hypothetical protein [Alphaproteobacteria bacterium]
MTVSMTASRPLPDLPLADWADTRDTLHLCCQVIGKVRMALHPKLNHWWHVPLYVSSTGLTTRAIPYDGREIEIAFDFFDGMLHVTSSAGERRSFTLGDQPVATFHERLFGALGDLGIDVEILDKPYDFKSETPFSEDREHSAWDRGAIMRYWQILQWANGVMTSFAGRFAGKQTPVHLFWHSFDLALTRFSGRAAPPIEGGTRADREAYSHEVISFGFWPGDDKLPEPAFYSYTYPEPDGLAEAPLEPDAAFWNVADGNAMAILKYADVKALDVPDTALLAFLQSAYDAGAARADWPVEDLRHEYAEG